ncbi:isoflavone reductase family protein-like protein CipA [Microdochium bolleyi]|uniref:Isoflavone reductase family protein-like protein CipA n=1 Tax=Microdochium bolleyi TaxID=196109 RepID=A0A136J933_9PEZI|nr:isoflavone reductase family protein-like protein CipA [Microdochium bolleyi]
MSSAPIKTVAITAATGALGSALFKKLSASGLFTVRVLSTTGSTSAFPAGTDVVKVDYTSVSSLTSALQGIDAVVSAAGNEGIPGQKVLIDAAIAAGVRRFLPSEFGSDLAVPKTKALPVFYFKVQTAEYLEAKVAELGPDSQFSYTYVYNSAFLDWGLAVGFLYDLRAQTPPPVWGTGDEPFSATTLASVGDAVVGVLSHPAETKNRAVYIRDIVLTQNKLITLVNELDLPGKEGWKQAKPASAAIEDVVGKAQKELAEGAAPGPGNMVPFLYPAIWNPEYNSGQWGKDNELLGVKGVSEADVKEIIRGVLAQ